MRGPDSRSRGAGWRSRSRRSPRRPRESAPARASHRCDGTWHRGYRARMAEAADVELAQVDLMNPGWFVDGPPHELFARMRAEAPVRWNRTANGGFWSLT